MAATRDDSLPLALLLAPFLIIAFSLGLERAGRQLVAQLPPLVVAVERMAAPERLPPAVAVAPDARRLASIDTSLSPPSTPVPPVLPSLALLMEPPPPVLPSLALLMEPPPPVLPSLALLMEPPPPVLPSLALLM
ncbi:MAG: hypothetical protein AB7F78_19375, partial [Hyphomicrobiaceae bacterium]